MKRIVIAIANGFGFGLSPFASGTTGAAVGIPLAVALTAIPSPGAQLAVALALTLLAIPICEAGERHYGRKDPGQVVADEWMLLPICFVWQLPLWEMLRDGRWLPALAFLATAFVVSRVFDILKLFPAFRLQALHGGFGIVLDDFFADVYAWFAIRLLALWLFAPHVLHF